MSIRPTPPSLEPYLSLPPELSSILLTSTLGCSINWLTTRFISSILTNSPSNTSNEQNTVLLVSWLHPPSFWNLELRRTTALDTSKPLYKNRLQIIDCCSTSLSLLDTQTLIQNSLSKTTGKTILILDNPSLHLATTTTSQSFNTFILTLRSLVHSTIITCSADLPLVSAATTNSNSDLRPTPIELESAAFITSQAYAARMVMSVRELETGAARDISGVLRITRGGKCYDDGDGEDVREAELLYLVQRDGNVKVFSRGE